MYKRGVEKSLSLSPQQNCIIDSHESNNAMHHHGPRIPSHRLCETTRGKCGQWSLASVHPRKACSMATAGHPKAQTRPDGTKRRGGWIGLAHTYSPLATRFALNVGFLTHSSTIVHCSQLLRGNSHPLKVSWSSYPCRKRYPELQLRLLAQDRSRALRQRVG